MLLRRRHHGMCLNDLNLVFPEARDSSLSCLHSALPFFVCSFAQSFLLRSKRACLGALLPCLCLSGHRFLDLALQVPLAFDESTAVLLCLRVRPLCRLQSFRGRLSSLL